MSKKGRVFIVSGPSGCGKSTVLKEVFKTYKNYHFSVSATTRAPRPGERDGVEYYFITEEKFDEMVEKGEFLEHARYAHCSYGTPRGPVEEMLRQGVDVFMDIELQGARAVKAAMPEAVSIFIAPPSILVLEERLRGRATDSEEMIRLRLETAKVELEAAGEYDHLVINDDYVRAASEVLAIIHDA